MNASVAQSLAETFAPLALNTVMLVFYFAVMLRYNPILTLVGVASVVINLVVSRIISNKRMNITRVQMRDAGKLAGATVAGIEMVETIKASGAENGFFEKWAGYQASVNTQQVRFERLNQYLGMIPELVASLANIAVLILGVYFTIDGKFTVGMIMAFQGFLGSFTEPAQTLISAGQTFQEMRTQMERVEDVMEYPTDVNCSREGISEDAKYSKLSGSVELKNVTFGYSRLAKPLIRNFNLTLKTGSRVAFVGTSGCGNFVTVATVTPHNVLMELRIPGRHDYLKILYRTIPHFDIVCNCILKQNDILIHHRQRSGKNTSVNFFYGLSVK